MSYAPTPPPPQITNIRMVKEVMREASFLYAELVQVRCGLAGGQLWGQAWAWPPGLGRGAAAAGLPRPRPALGRPSPAP